MWVWEQILDAVSDCLKDLPFLFAAFFLMEVLEHHAEEKMNRALSRAGAFGPLVGALLGCIPQCGFSIMASDFFAGGVISMGTLLAVYLSTSDEAVILLLSEPGHVGDIGRLILVKIIIGITAGYLVYVLETAYNRHHAHRKKQIRDLCENCGCHDDEPLLVQGRAAGKTSIQRAERETVRQGAAGSDFQTPEQNMESSTRVTTTDDSGRGSQITPEKHKKHRGQGVKNGQTHGQGTKSGQTHGQETGEQGAKSEQAQIRGKKPVNWKHLLKAAWHHTREVFLFLLLFTIGINLLLGAFGAETISNMFLSDTVLQPVLASIVGLIPNCASSVLLTQLYLDGVLSFGSAVAGLCSAAGLGLIVLFRVNPDRKESVKVVLVLLLISMCAGILIQYL